VRYAFDTSFTRSLKRFDPVQQLEVKHRIDLFIRALAAEQLPAGFGLTKLRPTLWEIRSGLAQRILFWRTHDEVRFTFVGNHDEVRRFLKHLG
jgi:hypothetical protein